MITYLVSEVSTYLSGNTHYPNTLFAKDFFPLSRDSNAERLTEQSSSWFSANCSSNSVFVRPSRGDDGPLFFCLDASLNKKNFASNFASVISVSISVLIIVSSGAPLVKAAMRTFSGRRRKSFFTFLTRDSRLLSRICDSFNAHEASRHRSGSNILYWRSFRFAARVWFLRWYSYSLSSLSSNPNASSTIISNTSEHSSTKECSEKLQNRKTERESEYLFISNLLSMKNDSFSFVRNYYNNFFNKIIVIWLHFTSYFHVFAGICVISLKLIIHTVSY